MEAFSVLNEMHRSRNQFRNQLDQQIGEMRRDSTSAHARELLSLLEQARIASDKLLEDIDTRLFSTVRRLSRDAELIGLTGEILEEQRKTILIEDPTDNLILHCILAHAREHPAEDKAFLTGDRKAFGDPKVQNELRHRRCDQDRSGKESSFGCGLLLNRGPDDPWGKREFTDDDSSRALMFVRRQVNSSGNVTRCPGSLRPGR